MPKLIFTEQNYAGQVYELTLEKTTVGRSQQNALVIPDKSLSSAHCEILVHGPEVIVCDLGSLNGTYVNGAKIRNQQAPLKHGQTVRFGAVEARLELEAQGSEDSTDFTALHAFQRISREQQAERDQPKPAEVPVQLRSSGSSLSQDHTVIATKTPPPNDLAPSSPREMPGRPVEPPSKKPIIATIVILVLALIVVLWKWFK